MSNECSKKEEITNIISQLHIIKTEIAVYNTKFSTLEKELDNMNKIIEKIDAQSDIKYSNIQNLYDKLVWFGFTSSIGVILTLVVSIVTFFIK